MRPILVLRIISICAVTAAFLMTTGCSEKPELGVAVATAQTSAPNAGSPATTPGGGTGSAATVPAAGPPGAAPAANLPPVSITSVRAQVRDFPVMLRANGSVTPLSNVDVRPQMSSVITRVHIKEGQFVKRGELMFTLDARADEANVARAMAQLQRDQASLADAQRQLARSKQLLAQNFVSQGAVDTAQAQVDAQTAVVATDKAAIDAARVPLSYARIVAPSTGRVGAIVVYPGSAVVANQTSLVTITQLDPIAVSFNLPQRHLQKVLALQSRGGAEVIAGLPESPDKLTGRLRFVDNVVDPNSGTVKVRAEFENKNNKLWPGAFAEISMIVDTLAESVVVPQASVIQTARGTVVYVVEDGKAALKQVKVVLSQGEDAAVTGVRPGAQVILDGRQSVRPGSPVIDRPRDGAGGGPRKGPPKDGAPGKDGGPGKESGPAKDAGPPKTGAGDGGKS